MKTIYQVKYQQKQQRMNNLPPFTCLVQADSFDAALKQAKEYLRIFESAPEINVIMGIRCLGEVVSWS